MKSTWIVLLSLPLLLLAGCAKDAAESPDAPAPPPAADAAMTPEAAQPAAAVDTCPVMGGKVVKQASNSAVHEGRRYYFCCGGCPATFKKDPDKFVRENPAWAEKWSEPATS